MQFPTQFVMAVAALVLGASAASIEENTEFAAALGNTSANVQRSPLTDFQFRFYDNGGCSHSSNPSDTWPSNGNPPGQGDAGTCYSAPTGVNWNRVEIDVFDNGGSRGLQTFCNDGCDGGASVKQQGTNCYLPIAGCAIGSFRVIG